MEFGVFNILLRRVTIDLEVGVASRGLSSNETDDLLVIRGTASCGLSSTETDVFLVFRGVTSDAFGLLSCTSFLTERRVLDGGI